MLSTFELNQKLFIKGPKTKMCIEYVKEDFFPSTSNVDYIYCWCSYSYWPQMFHFRMIWPISEANFTKHHHLPAPSSSREWGSASWEMKKKILLPSTLHYFSLRESTNCHHWGLGEMQAYEFRTKKIKKTIYLGLHDMF